MSDARCPRCDSHRIVVTTRQPGWARTMIGRPLRLKWPTMEYGRCKTCDLEWSQHPAEQPEEM